MYLIKTIKGDITKVTDVQAIVNAYNKGLDNSFFDGCKDPNNPSSDQLLPLL